MASLFCHNKPSNLKNLNIYKFSQQIKPYFFSNQIRSISNFEHSIFLNIHSSKSSVRLSVFAPYLLDSFRPFLFCFARKMRGPNSKTWSFICPPDSTFIHIYPFLICCYILFYNICKCVLSVKSKESVLVVELSRSICGLTDPNH